MVDFVTVVPAFAPAIFPSQRSVFEKLPFVPVVPESELPPVPFRVDALRTAIEFLPPEQRAREIARLEKTFSEKIVAKNFPEQKIFTEKEIPAPIIPEIFPKIFPEKIEKTQKSFPKISRGAALPPTLSFLPPAAGPATRILIEIAKRSALGKIVFKELGKILFPTAPQIEIEEIPEIFPVRLPTRRRRKVEPKTLPAPVEIPSPVTQPGIETLPQVVPRPETPAPARTAPEVSPPITLPEIVLPVPSQTPVTVRTTPATTPTVRTALIPALGLGLIVGTGLLLSARARVAQPTRARVPTRAPDVPLSPIGPTLGQPPSLVRGTERIAQPFRRATRTKQKKCQEVKRRRRRKGVCKEGFFEELPGRTRFETWREVDCLTRREPPTGRPVGRPRKGTPGRLEVPREVRENLDPILRQAERFARSRFSTQLQRIF